MERPGRKLRLDEGGVPWRQGPTRVYPRSPELGFVQAKRLLRTRHSTTDVHYLTTGGPTGVVASQRPAAGLEVDTGAIIKIYVRVCTPGYSPCLLKQPYGGDYNCANGDGSPPTLGRASSIK
jgi:hypothetical protein